jgi:hypothetical protein
MLWLNSLVDGASNLLWLASEQIVKILLLQKEIDGYSAKSTDLDEMHQILDEEGRKLGHNVNKLVLVIGHEYADLDISRFEPVLKKLQEYFYRRYVVREGSSISLTMLEQVDEFYFLLRERVHPDVGLGIIDEIHIQKKHGWRHPLTAFEYAYLNNKSFKPRVHREIQLRGPDGNTYMESGYSA